MKLNFIKQYQQGGVYTPTYVVYDPLPIASEATGARAATSAKEESSSEKGVVDKDLLLMIKEAADGLPSDVEPIISQLSAMYSRLALAEYLPGGGNKRNTAKIAAQYLQILGQLKIAKFNKQEYDRAYEQVSKNGGINEVAITARGQLVCFNSEKKDFKLMTPEELKKSSGYTPLTNSELLRYRANDVSLAGNAELLSVVQNGIGIKQVTEMIQGVINNLGTTSQEGSGYQKTKAGNIIQGLQNFEAAVQEAADQNFNGSIHDLYKVTNMTSSQVKQAEQAMAYIYTALPENAKSLLKSRTDLTDEGAKAMIGTLIASTLTSSSKLFFNLEGGPSSWSMKDSTKSASGKSSSSSDSGDGKLKATQNVSILLGFGGVDGSYTIDRGDGIQMTVVGTRYDSLRHGDTPITTTTLNNMLTQTGLSQHIKNKQAITFGDQKISTEALQYITYDNTGLVQAILPINGDGTVNLALLDQYKNVEKKIMDNGGAEKVTAEQKAQWLREEGLHELLLPNGLPNPAKFGLFAITEGFTTDALSGVQPSDFVKEYSGNTKAAIEKIKSAVKTEQPNAETKNLIDEQNWYEMGPLSYINSYDRVYKAAIYIPLDNNLLAAARMDGQKLDMDEAGRLQAKYQGFDPTRVGQSTSSEGWDI